MTKQTTTQRALLVTLILVGSGLTLAGGANAEDDIVLADGTTITTSITGRTITVPVGAQVQYAGDITITATLDIVIEGRLTGQNAAGGHAFGLDLIAGRTVSVTGSLVSAPGPSGTAATGTATATGTAGGHGGDINVQWGALGSFVLADGAYIQSGAGGNGGNANATATATSPTTIAAEGGAGGNGGAIRLQGGTAILSGTLRIGNGGKGGDASAWAPDGTPPANGGTVNATGGTGGASGEVVLPSGHTLLDLYTRGQTTGGVGGDGGAAATFIAAATCGSHGSWDNNPDVLRGKGENGCNGASSTSKGGDAGCYLYVTTCLVGGAGGSASGNAGHGGKGGNGAHGQEGWGVLYPMGGNGGNGGRGGDAANKGGRGGYGAAYGGKGGDASGNAGSGGWGGDGGNSGHRSGLSSGLAVPTSCNNWRPICWLGTSVDLACGHIGFSGSGGSAGNLANSAGAPGSSILGLNGGYGTWTGAGGTDGGPGNPGGYGFMMCGHNSPHAHF